MAYMVPESMWKTLIIVTIWVVRFLFLFLFLSIFQIKKYIFKMKAWRYLEIIVLHIPFYILRVSHVLDHLWNNKIWSGESLK